MRSRATAASPCGTPPFVLTSHAYSACTARPRARVSTLVRDIESVEEVGHLERRQRRVAALVAVLATGPFLGLLVIVRRQHAERHRHVELGARRREPAGA